MSGKSCRVSFKATEGTVHSVQVQADSLYEAVAKAARVFRRTGWLSAIAIASEFEVEVREPVVTHTVTLRQVIQWSDSSGPPNEAQRRDRVRNLLAS